MWKLKKKKSTFDKDKLILAALYIFTKKGEPEVSYSTFLESIAEFQKSFNLGYKFLDKYLYCSELVSDISKLCYRGDLNEFEYKHDAFLPKHFLSLTSFGESRGSEYFEKFFDKAKGSLESAVENSIENYKRRWRFYRRPRVQKFDKSYHEPSKKANS